MPRIPENQPCKCQQQQQHAAAAAAEARSVAYNLDESLRCAISALSRFIRDPLWTHARTAAVYGNYDEARNERAAQNRRDAVRLAQIRSGHRCAFRAYHHLMDSSTDPTCPNCGQAAHTVEHWLLDCSALTQARTDIFGRRDLSLDVLCTCLRGRRSSRWQDALCSEDRSGVHVIINNNSTKYNTHTKKIKTVQKN